MEEKSLRETLAEINKNLEELSKEKKVKKWNLPFTARIGMGKKKKRKGYVVFMNIGLNKALTFIKAPIEEGVAMVNGVPHVVTPEDILIWKNKIPIVIQPQWSEKPFSAEKHFKETKDKNEGTEGWALIMNYMMKNQITNKKPISGGLIVVGVLVLLGLGYYVFKSGALG